MQLDLLFSNWYYYYGIIANDHIKGELIMKKKIIVLALCTGMLVGTTAQAQKVQIVLDEQKVVFSDNMSPETLGICFVVKKGESIDDNSKVYALKNAESNANGEFEVSFIMPEMKNEAASDGEYEIYIKESGKAVKKAEFIYASLATRTALLGAIQGISQGDTKVQELKTILENADNLSVLKAIGCNTDKYNEETTASNMCNTITDFAAITLETFKDEYNIASVIGDFENVDKNTANELLTVINPQFEETRYNDITDEHHTDWLSSYFTENDYSLANYELANILYKFNTVVAEEIDDLFGQYDTKLAITSDSRYMDYNRLASKAVVNIKIADNLSKNPAKTVESLLEAVRVALNSGNGGGGSAGGGGSSSSVKPPVAVTPSGAGGLTGFKDLDQAEWARTAVMGLANAGIIAGDENGNFRPNDYVTREEYVKMLVLAANKHNIYATCEFEDVPKDAWYYSYVASAKQFGLTSGINEKEFGAGKALTRQDMAVLSLKAKGEVTKVRDDVTFADDSQIADYAKDAVSKLYMSGVVNGIGNNKFAPRGQATRAECAQIIYNLFMK